MQTDSRRSWVTIRDLARLIGKMSATAMAVLPVPLCYRSLQHLKNQALLASFGNFETKVPLDQWAKEELQWWSQELPRWNGRPITPPSPDLTVETDASLLGWGAVAEKVSTGGLWSEEERQMHINHLELLGAVLAVQTYTKDREVSRVHLRMDNRLQAELPAPTVHQLATRPACNGNRCIFGPVDRPAGARIPTILSDREMSAEDTPGEGNSDPHNTGLALPDMVPLAARDVDTLPSPPTEPHESSTKPIQQGPLPVSQGTTPASRLESIRGAHTLSGVSERASEIISAGWRRGTNSAYQSGWLKWAGWCGERYLDPISCDPSSLYPLNAWPTGSKIS